MTRSQGLSSPPSGSISTRSTQKLVVKKGTPNSASAYKGKPAPVSASRAKPAPKGSGDSTIKGPVPKVTNTQAVPKATTKQPMPRERTKYSPSSESSSSSSSSSTSSSPSVSPALFGTNKSTVTPKSALKSQGAKKGKEGEDVAEQSVRMSGAVGCPLTPQSEFKLLSDDLSPSFGTSSSTYRYTAQVLPSFSFGVTSPLIPFSQSSRSAAVPSSREWFTGSSSSSNGNSTESEWSNSMPEFSFSEAGSPGGVGSSPAGGVSQRPSKGGLETNFGGLFMEPSMHAKRQQDYDITAHSDNLDENTAEDGMPSKRRRKKRMPGGEDFEGSMMMDMRGSPVTQTSTLHSVTPDGEVKIRCNCKRSKCLKLYCDCLRNNKYCDGCNCYDCCNVERCAAERSAAIKCIMDRNPSAFRARIAEDPMSMSKEHLSGCHCKKSMCLKKYCEVGTLLQSSTILPNCLPAHRLPLYLSLYPFSPPN